MDLERHPLVRKITKAVPGGRKLAFSLVVIQTVRRVHRVLQLKVCTVPRSRERLRKWVIRAMLWGSGARIVYSSETALVGIRYYYLQGRARGVEMTGLIACANETLNPPFATV